MRSAEREKEPQGLKSVRENFHAATLQERNSPCPQGLKSLRENLGFLNQSVEVRRRLECRAYGARLSR
jgi:hypothetical protein